MGSEKYPTNRAIAPGVGNMSGIGGVLASREVELCTPPALQELCMHCCAELVPFSRESCWVLDELKMVWFGVRKNRWHKFLFTVFKKKKLFQNCKLSNRSFLFSFFNLTWSIWILSSGSKTKAKCEEARPDFQHGCHFLVLGVCS